MGHIISAAHKPARFQDDHLNHDLAVDLTVEIELGRTQIAFSDLAKLPDSILLLDRSASDPIDLVVNDRTVARGELVVMNDQLCVRICEIISREGAQS